MPIQAGNIEWCCTSLEVKNIAVTASEHLAITLVSQMSARAFLMLLNASNSSGMTVTLLDEQ